MVQGEWREAENGSAIWIPDIVNPPTGRWNYSVKVLPRAGEVFGRDSSNNANCPRSFFGDGFGWNSHCLYIDVTPILLAPAPDDEEEESQAVCPGEPPAGFWGRPDWCLYVIIDPTQPIPGDEEEESQAVCPGEPPEGFWGRPDWCLYVIIDPMQPIPGDEEEESQAVCPGEPPAGFWGREDWCLYVHRSDGAAVTLDQTEGNDESVNETATEEQIWEWVDKVVEEVVMQEEAGELGDEPAGEDIEVNFKDGAEIDEKFADKTIVQFIFPDPEPISGEQETRSQTED